MICLHYRYMTFEKGNPEFKFGKNEKGDGIIREQENYFSVIIQ